MKIHEFQAKSLLASRGLTVPRGLMAASPEAVEEAALRLGPRVVLKAQVHAGGRGEAGGVRFAGSPGEARRMAAEILGRTLVTAQTGDAGKPVRRLLVEEAVSSIRGIYAAATIDRKTEKPLLILSAKGGVNIERTARENPASIIREEVSVSDGLSDERAGLLAERLGVAEPIRAGLAVYLREIVRFFLEKDATLVEINPLALVSGGRWIVLDAKMSFDDNALPRRPEIAALHDPAEDDPGEAAAAAAGLNYVRLGGNIGCMVNGAGLAMATADIILQSGGHPADFLDIGGGVTEAAVAEGFRILASDPAVKAVWINVFGGIVRCDLVARGLVQAASLGSIRLPLVVRLKGTNVEEGRAVLAASGLRFVTAETMDEAAAAAVRLASGTEFRT